NAVTTQVWTAVATYVLVALVKKRLGLTQSLYTILQILNLVLYEKMPILQVFSKVPDTFNEPDACNQLKLFDF
ncbi:MAG: IS4 family transposase, partial [Planctomycetota bacterium]|nr:IS4 family transposase [Planctomycetota bacterium]